MKTEVISWEERMRAGDFTGAWRVADESLRSRGNGEASDWPWHLPPIWDGSPLTGKRVLVRCYHDFSDTIQFIRFIRPLQAVARRVVTCVQPALLPLIRTMPGHGRLLPLHGEPDFTPDVEIELLELPHYFRATPETLPGSIPYLHPPRSALPRRHPARPAVGLVWEAGGWDPMRSIAPAELAPLTRTGVELFVLQRGSGRDSWPHAAAADVGSDDPLVAAAAIRALDLLVTVDGVAAHLAGSLGVPVWTLLAHHADWRWMEAREDTPWYPTMRLFRQQHPGDWRAVIEEVAAGLTLRVGHSMASNQLQSLPAAH